MKSPLVCAIVAMDEGRLIGREGALPWHVPEDLKRFRDLTSGHIVVMGRKTWESLPPKVRPLPGRLNIVVSRNPVALALPDGVLSASSPAEAIAKAAAVATEGQRVWIIGGAEVYREAIPLCSEVFLTVVKGRFSGDAWLAPFEDSFYLSDEASGEACSFRRYTRRSC